MKSKRYKEPDGKIIIEFGYGIVQHPRYETPKETELYVIIVFVTICLLCFVGGIYAGVGIAMKYFDLL